MNDIYKIETYSDMSAANIASFITRVGGRCIVQGWAVITDFTFSSSACTQLLPLISSISEDVSDADRYYWHLPLEQAA
jgi:hypothetical protein